MAHDESQHPRDGHSQTLEPPGAPVSPMTIDTANPAIDAAGEHLSDWKLNPDATIRVATTPLGEPDLPRVSGARTVDSKKTHPQPGDDRGAKTEDRGEDQSHRKGELQPRQEPEQPPSMMKNLLVTASVALVCGVIGATGYAYFFGPKATESSADQSQGKSDSGSKNEPGSKKKSGNHESKKSDAQSSTTHSNPADSSANDADTAKQQFEELSQRVDHLRERLDGVTRPTDATPPLLRNMQIKMRELAHEMAGVAALPTAYREYDNRLETLEEELETLRARVGMAKADRQSALNK